MLTAAMEGPPGEVHVDVALVETDSLDDPLVMLDVTQLLIDHRLLLVGYPEGLITTRTCGYEGGEGSADQRLSWLLKEGQIVGGFSVEETADALGVSAQTVMRDWKLARAWLTRELGHT